MIWYQKMQCATKTLAIAAMRGQTQKRMQHRKKGLKAMSRAVSPTPPRPLLHTKRDREGPKGEKVGSITTDPAEVDSIATRAWQAIYDGNIKELFFGAKAFIGKYRKHIYKAPIYQLKEVNFLNHINLFLIIWNFFHQNLIFASQVALLFF